MLELQFANSSSVSISDFNIQVNKNAFGVCPDAPVSKHGIVYPAPGETGSMQLLPLNIEKKNASGAPANPFQLQIALNSSLDVFYFNVDCALQNMINYVLPADQRLSKDDFRKFWDKLGADKTVTITLD